MNLPRSAPSRESKYCRQLASEHDVGGHLHAVAQLASNDTSFRVVHPRHDASSEITLDEIRCPVLDLGESPIDIEAGITGRSIRFTLDTEAMRVIRRAD